LNVNFPKLKESEIKGIRICRQAALWVEKFEAKKHLKEKTITGLQENL
jgi:5'-nucleotidase